MALPLCGCEPQASAGVEAALVDAPAAPELASVVQVRHRDVPETCSGTLVARDVVVTAGHCAFRAGSQEPEPLPSDGFRVFFGPDEEVFEERNVRELRLVGGTQPAQPGPARDRGEDVAVLLLDSPAPASVLAAGIRFGYGPVGGDRVVLSGFGISSTETGQGGVRRAETGVVTAFDPETGVMMVEGPAACFGDSGGPGLFGRGAQLVGVIGEAGGSSDDRFCDLGVTFLSTVANPAVEALLRSACEGAGGCGQQRSRVAAGDDGGTEGLADGPAALVLDGAVSDGSVEAGGMENAGQRDGSEEAVGGCAAGRGDGRRGSAPWPVLAVLGVWRRWGSKGKG